MVATVDVTLDGDSFGAQLPGDRSGGTLHPRPRIVDQVVTVMPGMRGPPAGFSEATGAGGGAPLLTRVIDANRTAGPSPAAW